ncbi:MAG: hypothetical protein ACUVWP_05585 [bacterium]
MRILYLILISISLTSLTGIFWEDNFDSYYEGVPLGESPYWKFLFGDDDAYVYGGTSSANDLDILFYDGTSEYYANGGYYSIFYQSHDDVPSYLFGIGAIVDGKFYTLADSGLAKIGPTIRQVLIKAVGYDPVYIVARFNDFELYSIDNVYKFESGYGVILSGSRCSCCSIIVDEFIEETTTDITPSSIGSVKALFK